MHRIRRDAVKLSSDFTECKMAIHVDGSGWTSSMTYWYSTFSPAELAALGFKHIQGHTDAEFEVEKIMDVRIGSAGATGYNSVMGKPPSIASKPDGGDKRVGRPHPLVRLRLGQRQRSYRLDQPIQTEPGEPKESKCSEEGEEGEEGGELNEEDYTEEVFEVEKIMDSRIGLSGTTEYKIRWKGFKGTLAKIG